MAKSDQLGMLESGHEIVVYPDAGLDDDYSWHFYHAETPEHESRDDIETVAPIRKEFQKNGEAVNVKIAEDKQLKNDTKHNDWELVKHN